MKRKRKTKPRPQRAPMLPPGVLFELRSSPISGTGAFALQPIRKGTRLIEYTGQRISHEDADKQPDDVPGAPTHVLLFTVDKNTVVDAAVGGNEARFINHSCDPNCESEIERGRIYIDAIRDIEPGEELTYDYALTRESTDDEAEEAKYPCRCGSPKCRGTLLEPRKRRRKTRRKATRQSQVKSPERAVGRRRAMPRAGARASRARARRA